MRLIIAICLLGVVVAAPATYPVHSGRHYNNKNVNAQLLCYENGNIGCTDIIPPSRVSYRYASEQSDVQTAEDGNYKKEGLAVVGSYSWIGPDGVKYTLKYVSDDSGNQPESYEEDEAPGSAPVPLDVLATLAG